MAAIIEVNFFNSFLAKKIAAADGLDASKRPLYNGSFGIPEGVNGAYPVYSSGESDSSKNSWVIEESRIRGGFNNTSSGYGVRAYLQEESIDAERRSNSLIYSGIYNSRTGVNNTNVFNVGQDITKSADPSNGSIQKLYAEDTNLVIFQENKISRALIDKDAIYNAEGGGAVTSSNLVIGQIVPYAGNFGISKNPESFAVYGYRKYFTDKNRNVVLRLSQDGLTEISNYGMLDYFRDQFNGLDYFQQTGEAIASYDIHNKQYSLYLKSANEDPDNKRNVITFDEQVKGWTSFFSYKPERMFSVGGNYYSYNSNKIWKHYADDVNRGSFYGDVVSSKIQFIFNPKVSTSKVFKTINYEGTDGWQIEAQGITTDTGDYNSKIYSYSEGSYVRNGIQYYAGFYKKENKYFSEIKNNTAIPQPGQVFLGNAVTGVKGFTTSVTIETDNTNLSSAKELFAVSSEYVESSY
mgnify:FL=1